MSATPTANLLADRPDPGFTAASPVPEPPLAPLRTGGKFLYAGDQKLYLTGVTYGTFGGGWGDDLPHPDVVTPDFSAMAANGVNTVRTYTVPPGWMLDLAARNGLRVLVGIPWEQHVTFLDDRGRRKSIERRIRAAVSRTAGHPAVAGYVVGNEIPAGIVRWHGRRRVENFIEQLYRAAKAEDPTALVTYANYPSTEYLHLPFLDLVCFNIFLEDHPRFETYLARLQTLTGDRPLVVSELGLDSRRHGAQRQAAEVSSQARATFAGGCAGCFVFAWTDEWNRGGYDVEDWDFGLVDRARQAKPALKSVRSAFAEVPFGENRLWPRVSVVVCTYNGAQTIGDCVEGLLELDYPEFEVIVVDDGSNDDAGGVAGRPGVRVIRTDNQGLSAARNTGINAASGEIIAFCDDDCRPDPHWLRYLVSKLMSNGYAGVGGPNVPPPDHVVAESVGHAPGGPMHVLTSELEAEHIPGCNMAFHRDVLERVGGFDTQFKVAGDDVDICWRIQAAGEKLGFSPGALVWHRARGSVRAYLRQQVGYGRAEALLERKWPERYNGRGHVDWAGTVYGGKVRKSFGRGRWRVYYGASGSGLFQSVYHGAPRGRAIFPTAPEWYLLVLALAAASIYGLAGGPLFAAVPPFGGLLSLVLLIICLAVIGTQAASWAGAVVLPPSTPRRRRVSVRALVFVLCVVQPLARLWGRTHSGLTPWRQRAPQVLALPVPRRVSVWSERWAPPQRWVEQLDANLRETSAQVTRGGDFDTWDIQVRVGALAAGRVRVAAEEHGQGRQMVRFRAWPCCSRRAVLLDAMLGIASAWAASRGAVAAAGMLGAICLWLMGRIFVQAAAAVVLPARAAASLHTSGDAGLTPQPMPAPAVAQQHHLAGALPDALVAMAAASADSVGEGT